MASENSKTRNKLLEIGDSVKKTYDETKDLKAALIAIRAYGEATKTAMVEIKYKHLTGKPETVEYLEK